MMSLLFKYDFWVILTTMIAAAALVGQSLVLEKVLCKQYNGNNYTCGIKWINAYSETYK